MPSISTDNFESNYFNKSNLWKSPKAHNVVTCSVLVLLVFVNRLGCFVISFIL